MKRRLVAFWESTAAGWTFLVASWLSTATQTIAVAVADGSIAVLAWCVACSVVTSAFVVPHLKRNRP